MGKKIGAGFLWSLFIFFTILAKVAAGQEVIKVGILPFAVYAEDPQKLGDWPSQVAQTMAKDLGKDEHIVLVEEKEMEAALSRKGAGEIDETRAREIGHAVDADFVLQGSLTQINGAVSLDVRILDVHEQGVLVSAFSTGKREEGVAAIVARLSKEINVKILKKEIVEKVLVEGNKVIEESAIRAQIKIKSGDVFSPRALRDDLKAIFQLGYFKDVRGEKKDWARGKMVVFVVEEKPIIREIKFSGNKAIKTSDLKEVITVRTRTVLNLNGVQESINKIIQKYRDEAFFFAEVKYELETPREGETIVHFLISESTKVRIKNITFSGNLHFPDAQLKKILPETKEADFFSWVDKSGTYKEDLLERDLDVILLFYLQRGFMQAKVGKPKVTFDKEGIRIDIPLEEGRQFRVGKVEILGDLILPKVELMKKIPLYAGEILNRDYIRDSVTILTDLYADKGYAFVDVNPQTIMHPEEPI
ncbi:MAG: hypothetical protein NTY64_06470, partial [Deltaproteobacteria bacterium]|nr:hypothetical protein [Deltaproteobacteria bacterium]